MWENNSSRACSNAEGGDSLRGSERFLAMPEVLLSCQDRERGGRGIDRRRNVIGRWKARKGPSGRVALYYHGRRRGRVDGPKHTRREAVSWAITRKKCTGRTGRSACSPWCGPWPSASRRLIARVS